MRDLTHTEREAIFDEELDLLMQLEAAAALAGPSEAVPA